MVQPIDLNHHSQKLFFLIHGYTGSPTDFNALPDYLFSRYPVDVKVMLLKGHGTKIEDLDDLELQDFLDQGVSLLRYFKKY